MTNGINKGQQNSKANGLIFIHIFLKTNELNYFQNGTNAAKVEFWKEFRSFFWIYF